jgi:protein-L-isoaspartate(D-aspartate) O-methyltransferase
MANEQARFNMIEQQIRTWEVLDPVVLQLLNDLHRESFVPASYHGLAFADLEIPIGHGQSMLSPKLEGRMLQALSLKNTDKVLHIGTGTGYLTALLAQLAESVVTIEIFPDLLETAKQNLQQHSIANVMPLVGDGAHGWLALAPYDVIVFGASSPVEPATVRDQLNVGGRMLIIIGKAPVMQATLIQRVSENGFRQDVIFETCITELQSAEQGVTFNF